MNNYQTLSGETLTYESPPVVASFLARLTTAAANPSVSTNDMILMVYGSENPLLNHDQLPGHAMVTPAIFNDPLYHVMTDLIGRKRVQKGEIDLSKTDAPYTVSVPDAADRLGITPAAVRNAITTKRLSAIFRNGQWWIRPQSLDSYKVGTRGRKKNRV